MAGYTVVARDTLDGIDYNFVEVNDPDGVTVTMNNDRVFDECSCYWNSTVYVEAKPGYEVVSIVRTEWATRFSDTQPDGEPQTTDIQVRPSGSSYVAASVGFSDWVNGSCYVDYYAEFYGVQRSHAKVTVTVRRRTAQVTVSSTAGGSAGLHPGGAPSGSFNVGDSCTVSATPLPGHSFAYWTGVPGASGRVRSSQCTFTVSGDAHLTAVFGTPTGLLMRA